MIVDRLNDNKFVVRTFSPDEGWHGMEKKLEDYRDGIILKDDPADHKMLKNYTKEMLDFNEQICISILTKDDNILAFSTLYERKDYGNSAVRCLNRLYFDPSVRQWNKEQEKIADYDCNPRVNVISPLMINQQMHWALDFDLTFISSEPWKPRWAKMIAKNFTEASKYLWHTDDRLYPVCCDTERSCWQHLIWFGEGDLLDKGISKQEFDDRFK